jgi:hypothetical protein
MGKIKTEGVGEVQEFVDIVRFLEMVLWEARYSDL